MIVVVVMRIADDDRCEGLIGYNVQTTAPVNIFEAALDRMQFP